jgi:hypothetical protein
LRALHDDDDDDDIGCCCCCSAHSILKQHFRSFQPARLDGCTFRYSGTLLYIHVYRLATELYKTSPMSTAEAQTSGRARAV